MATLKEIAERANTSMATVSRVLNQDQNILISEEVRNRIFDIAHELNYVPPKKRRIKAEKGIKIGIADWHIIREDRDNIKLRDYISIATRFCKAPVEFERMIYGEPMEVEGIIALGSFSEEEVMYLKKQSYAILFINSDRHDYQYDRIIMDYNEGLMQMVHYILETKGYENIGYIGGYYEKGPLVIGKTRHHALMRILKARDKYKEENFFIGELSKESGYQMAKEAIVNKRLARAVLLGNDQIAEGALEAIEEAGLRVPEDVAVVVYKDIETLRSKFPTYTAIQMLPDFVWETAIKLLLERITGARSETMTVILPSKFYIGN